MTDLKTRIERRITELEKTLEGYRRTRNFNEEAVRIARVLDELRELAGTNEPSADVRIENQAASVCLARPLTEPGKRWLEEHTDGQWFGGALAVEPRFVANLVDGMIGDGLEVA